MITIGLTGDVMIGRLVNDHLPRVDPTYIWGDLLPELQKMDLNLINLEAALTMCEEAVPKVFNFKADPEHVQTLKAASIHVANLANNHVLDFTEQGLIDTLDTLDKANILHIGAGKNLAQAKMPVILTKNGIRIGILGCTDNEPDWVALDNRPGTCFINVGDIAAIKQDILALREQVDILILTMHWGPNMRERPTKSFVNFAHHLIDSGVDIFHGHSAHIFQGVEIYKNKLILFDTGDFVDDYYVDPLLRNDRSFFFEVSVSKKGVEGLNLIPTMISNFRVNKSHGTDAEETMDRMKMLSKEMNTSFEVVNGQLKLILN